jgi:hypothetical protein
VWSSLEAQRGRHPWSPPSIDGGRDLTPVLRPGGRLDVTAIVAEDHHQAAAATLHSAIIKAIRPLPSRPPAREQLPVAA